MEKSVDDILFEQRTSDTEKLTTIVDNLKEITSNARTESDAESDDKDNSSSDDRAPTAKDNESGKDDKQDRKTKKEKSHDTDGDTAGKRDADTNEPLQEKGTDDETSESDDGNESDETDEYGEPLSSKSASLKENKAEKVEKAEKEKMYTSEDVNRMIRERMERMKVPQSSRDDIQDKVDNFQSDPNSEDDWQKQLKAFVAETIREKQEEEIQAQRQVVYEKQIQEDHKVQADFEDRFTNGMAKRSDFRKVAQGMPITDSIMLSIRNFKDPAGFIYAAAKNKRDEFERIANLRDPLHQATELGKLQVALMRPAKKTSNAPPVINRKRGDMAKGEMPQRTVDDLIEINQRNVKRS